MMKALTNEANKTAKESPEYIIRLTDQDIRNNNYIW